MTNEEIEKLIEDFCDNYCRMPQLYMTRYNDADDAAFYMVEEVCQNCPLERLKRTE